MKEDDINGDQIKMSDVFALPLTAEQHEQFSGWFTVDDRTCTPIDDSGDGGFEEDKAKAIALAVNEYDRLKTECKRLQDELDRIKPIAQSQSRLLQNGIVYTYEELKNHDVELILRLANDLMSIDCTMAQQVFDYAHRFKTEKTNCD